MSSSETIDNAIRFAQGLEAAVGDLCDNCKQRIREELKSRGAGRRAIPNQHSARRPEIGEPITAAEGHYYEEVQLK
jgi:hypothetical protein